MSHVRILLSPTVVPHTWLHLHVGNRVMAFVEGSIHPTRAPEAKTQEYR